MVALILLVLVLWLAVAVALGACLGTLFKKAGR